MSILPGFLPFGVFPTAQCASERKTSGRGESLDENAFKKNVLIARILLVAFAGSSAVYFVLFSIFIGISDFLVVLGLSMLFIGPAYIANAMMVFTGDNRPIDRGKFFIDGKRLFGQTKTIGGFLGGVISGFLFALLFNFIFFLNYPAIQVFAETQVSFLNYITLAYLSDFLSPPIILIPIRAFFCGLGAPLGDLIKSFVKRRLAIESGKPFWFFDQLDFILTTVLLNVCWFPLDVFIIFFLFLFSPSITLLANNIAYTFGKKSEPW